VSYCFGSSCVNFCETTYKKLICWTTFGVCTSFLSQVAVRFVFRWPFDLHLWILTFDLQRFWLRNAQQILFFLWIWVSRNLSVWNCTPNTTHSFTSPRRDLGVISSLFYQHRKRSCWQRILLGQRCTTLRSVHADDSHGVATVARVPSRKCPVIKFPIASL